MCIRDRNYGEASGIWLENTRKIISLETGRGQMGSDLIALKMSEIIFTQVLRTFLQDEGPKLPVLAGFADAGIGRALTAVHKEPGYHWTLENLAAIAGMSRTAFATRFSHFVTMSPLEYITHWRMQIARQQLTNSNDPIIKIAETVGYQSEAAFGRVFKKHHL